MKKYIIINGSPRKGGNSDNISNFIKEYISLADIDLDNVEIEEFKIRDKNISPCQADNGCKIDDAYECVIEDDGKDLVSKLSKCDGAFLVSPVYFMRLPGPLATAIDRFYSVFNHENMFKEVEEVKKLGIVLTLGGDNLDDCISIAEHTAFCFKSSLLFSENKNVICGANNDLQGFLNNTKQQEDVEQLVEWFLES